MSALRSPYLALRHRDFRRLVIGQFISLVGSQMQSVAINWHIYLLTRSALALGLVGGTRLVPIVVFSLWGGVLADRKDRRKVMIVTQTAMTAVALALAAVTFFRGDRLWILYALNAIGSAAHAFDAPSRQALIPRLVSAEDLPGALSLNVSMFQAALITGPAIAGLMIAGTSAGLVPATSALAAGGAAATGTRGLAVIYLINALSFVAVILALVTMRSSGRPAQTGRAPVHPLTDLAEGLRFVFSTPLIVWSMALDFVATFFSGATSLLPIFADQVLRVGARGYGVLMSAPAVGAFLGSLYLSVRALPRRQGQIFLWAVAAYGGATVVFGLSRSFPLTLAALAGVGLADAISTVIRQTLRQLVTPDRLRGRMTSVNMIFFMGGPQLGELEAGFVASLFASATVGVTVSVVSGGVATLGAVAAIAASAPILRRYDYRQHGPATALQTGTRPSGA